MAKDRNAFGGARALYPNINPSLALLYHSIPLHLPVLIIEPNSNHTSHEAYEIFALVYTFVANTTCT